MRILVIEDDQSVRETLGLVLEACNYEADLVDGWEQAQLHLSKSWPDAMLLDLTLAGMTGEEVFERIHGRFGRVPPTVVLSAAQEGASRASTIPGAWFLAKPYTIELLIEVLGEAASSRGAA
jgi:DNA-binding response OmpR family regulator